MLRPSALALRAGGAFLICSAAALGLAACGSVASPGSSERVLPVFQDTEGGRYRIREVGGASTLWRVDEQGELVEPALAEGLGSDYRVTTPGQFFAKIESAWWRLRNGEPEHRMVWFSDKANGGGWQAAPTEPPSWLAYQISFSGNPDQPTVPQSKLYQSVFVVGCYVDARGELIEGRSTDECFVLEDGLLLASDGAWAATDFAGRPSGRRYDLLERQHEPVAKHGRFLFVSSDELEVVQDAFWLEVDLADEEGRALLPETCVRRPLALEAWDEVRFAQRTRADAPRIWLGRRAGAAGYVRLDRELQPVRPDEPLLERVVSLHPGGILGDDVRTRHELFRYVDGDAWCLAVNDKIRHRDLVDPEIVPFVFRRVHSDGSQSDEEALGLVMPGSGGGYRLLGRVKSWWKDWGGTQESISQVCAVAAAEISEHEYEEMRRRIASIERFRQQQAETARRLAEAERRAREKALADARALAEREQRAEAAEVVCTDCRGRRTWSNYVMEHGREVVYECGWLYESGHWVTSRRFDPAPCPTCGGDGTSPEGARRPLVRQPPDFRRLWPKRWP